MKNIILMYLLLHQIIGNAWNMKGDMDRLHLCLPQGKSMKLDIESIQIHEREKVVFVLLQRLMLLLVEDVVVVEEQDIRNVNCWKELYNFSMICSFVFHFSFATSAFVLVSFLFIRLLFCFYFTFGILHIGDQEMTTLGELHAVL